MIQNFWAGFDWKLPLINIIILNKKKMENGQ